MPLSYKKLFSILSQKGISISNLRHLKIEPINAKTAKTIKENGSVTLTTICRLCDALQCDIADIVQYIPDEKELTSEKRGLVFTSDIKTIPIKLYNDPASAGYGFNNVDDLNYEIINIANTPTNCEADYAVCVSGYSMLPMFTDKDMVLVKQTSTINQGECGIFTVNDETYIKQLGDGELISINPNFPNIKFSENDTVICNGLVLGKIEKIKRKKAGQDPA